MFWTAQPCGCIHESVMGQKRPRRCEHGERFQTTSGLKPKERKPLKRTCEQCGKEFMATQEHKGYRRRFCGAKCSGLANKAKAVAAYPPEDEIRRVYVEEGLSDRELGRRFGYSYQWAFNVRRHYKVAGRRSARTKPLEKQRDRGRWAIGLKREDACRNCGVTNGTLHLHHAVPRSKSTAGKYDLRNGLPLCARCHLGWHHGDIVLYRDIFTAEEWAFVESLIHPSWLDQKYPERPEDGGYFNRGTCRNGHERTEETTHILPSGKKRCRVCSRERQEEYRDRKREMAE